MLLLAAMALFAYTVGIGILNGTDLVDFDRRRVLSHVHGGTLGWLTLAVFAAALWLFGQGTDLGRRERQLVRSLTAAAILAVVAYVAAFALTYGGWGPPLRPGSRPRRLRAADPVDACRGENRAIRCGAGRARRQ